MFLRTKSNGTRTYLQLVESERCGRKVRQRVLATLGRLDQLQNSGALDRLLLSVSRFCEHAAVLADAGLDRRGIAERLHQLCAHSPDQLARYAAAFAPRRTQSTGRRDQAAAGSSRNCFTSPDDILIAVAGGTGLYSMVMPTWCGGPHRNRAISVQVETDQYCEIPSTGTEG